METQSYPLYAPGDILEIKGIEHREVVLFMVLFGMMRLEGYCWATNEYLCARLGYSERTLQRSMKILQSLRLIRIETDGCNRRIYPVKYDANPVKSDTPTPSDLSPLEGSSIFLINKVNKRTKNVSDKKGIEEKILELYKKYPLKKGKTVGVKRLLSQINNQDQLNELSTAITNYASECKGKEEQYIKHFSTFAGCWQDYIEQPEKKKSELVEMKIVDGKMVPA